MSTHHQQEPPTIDKPTLREQAKTLKDGGMQCNCDLDNWSPEPETGHSHVCRIHKAALAQSEAHREPVVIRMNARGVTCSICGKETDDRWGVPRHNGDLVSNAFAGEWASTPACESCFKAHADGRLVTCDAMYATPSSASLSLIPACEIADVRVDAARWRALFRPGGRVRVLGTSFRPAEPYYHIGLELWSHYPGVEDDADTGNRATLTEYADGVAAINVAAAVDPWPTVEQSPPPLNVQLRVWRHDMASDTLDDGELHAKTDGDGVWMIGPELILRDIHPLDRWQRVTPPAGLTLPPSGEASHGT